MTLFQSTVGRPRPAKDCHDGFWWFLNILDVPHLHKHPYIMLCSVYICIYIVLYIYILYYIYNIIYNIIYIYIYIIIYPKYIWDVYHIFGPPTGFSFCHSSWNQPSPRQAQRPTPRGCSNVASPAFSGFGKSTWPWVAAGGDGGGPWWIPGFSMALIEIPGLVNIQKTIENGHGGHRNSGFSWIFQ